MMTSISREVSYLLLTDDNIIIIPPLSLSAPCPEYPPSWSAFQALNGIQVYINDLLTPRRATKGSCKSLAAPPPSSSTFLSKKDKKKHTYADWSPPLVG